MVIGRFAGFTRLVAAIMLSLLATACVVPNSMHISQGVSPQKLETNVRFQTTYYFRTFDYCWNANAPFEDSQRYRDIVPETDTLYRYRMTGKASALGNKIKFESGTLSKNQIDPFGTDCVFDENTGQHHCRDYAEAKQEYLAAAKERKDAAEQAAKKALAEQASQRLDKVVAALATAQAGTLGGTLTEAQVNTLKEAVRGDMKTAMQDIAATLKPAADSSLTAEVASLTERIGALDATSATLSTDVKQLKADTKELQEKWVAKTLKDFCSIGEIRKRGFQIMGPEGMRDFDQDSRLIMAMHSSAKPLIETLSEYSNRMLKPRVNASDQLLPLAQETTVLLKTERRLDRALIEASADEGAKPKVANIFDAAIRVFSGEAN